MYHANVGGCCDCGDVCWSQNTWCDKHKVKINPEPFPDDLQTRSKLVLDTICEYIYFYLYSVATEVMPDTATDNLKAAIEYVNKIVCYSSNFAFIVQNWFNEQSLSPEYIMKHNISSAFNSFRCKYTNLEGVLYSITRNKCNDIYMDNMSDLLLSLLDKPWKAIFTPCFTNHYFDFIDKMSYEIREKQKKFKYVTNSYEAYTTSTEVFLDRIVCQLFNDPEADYLYLLRNGFLKKVHDKVIEYFSNKYVLVLPNKTLFDNFSMNDVIKPMLALDYDNYKELTHDRIFSDFLMFLGESETFKIYIREEGVIEKIMDIVYFFHVYIHFHVLYFIFTYLLITIYLLSLFLSFPFSLFFSISFSFFNSLFLFLYLFIQFTDAHQFIPQILRTIPAKRRSTFDENFPLMQMNCCRGRLSTQFQELYKIEPELTKSIILRGIKRIVENIRKWNKEHLYWEKEGNRRIPITMLKCSSNLALNTILSSLFTFYNQEETIKIIEENFTENDCNLIEIMCVRFFAYYYQVLSSLWPRNVDLQELIPYYNDQYYCESVLLSTFFTLQVYIVF